MRPTPRRARTTASATPDSAWRTLLHPERLHPESPGDPTLWPPTQWGEVGGATVSATPDVVVLDLGSNDLWLSATLLPGSAPSTSDGGTRPPIPVGSPTDGPDAGPSLAQGFVQFVNQLAANFPSATFVLLSVDANQTEVEDAIDEVVAYYAAAPDAAPTVRVPAFADGLQFPGSACGAHPNVVAQRAGGERLAAYVRQEMRW